MVVFMVFLSLFRSNEAVSWIRDMRCVGSVKGVGWMVIEWGIIFLLSEWYHRVHYLNLGNDFCLFDTLLELNSDNTNHRTQRISFPLPLTASEYVYSY